MSVKTEEGIRKKKNIPRYQLTEGQYEEIKEAYSMFEIDDNGELNIKELKFAIRCLGFEPRKYEVEKLLKEIGKEKCETINMADFIEIIMLKMAEKGSKDEIQRAFRLFDDDETGKISFKNLKRVAELLGENLSEEQLQAMLDEADMDGDGEINEVEFFRIMEKTNLY